MPDEDPYGLEVQAFVDSVARSEPVPVDPNDSLKSLKVTLAAIESARTGQPVNL